MRPPHYLERVTHMIEKHRLVLILAAMAMVGPLGIDTYLPSFHAIGETYQVGPLVVQQTLSVFIIAFASMMLVYGTLSDSFGRRPVLLVSLTIFTLSSLAAAFATSITMLIVIRAIQGLSAGAGSVIGRAIIQDRFQGGDAQRIMAQVMMLFGIAPAIAPVIGGWLEYFFGWHSVFIFLALSGGGLWFACYVGLTESLPKDKLQPFNLRTIGRNYWRALCNGQFILMCLGIGFLMTGISLYIGSAASFVMTILKLPETAFAWMFIPLIGGSVIGASMVGRLSRRFQSKQLVAAGLAISLCATLLSVLYNSIWSARIPYAVMPLALYTLGTAIATPGMILLTLQQYPQMRGLAASMQGFIQMLIFALISGLVAPMLFDSALHIAIGHALGVGLGITLWYLACSQLFAPTTPH